MLRPLWKVARPRFHLTALVAAAAFLPALVPAFTKDARASVSIPIAFEDLIRESSAALVVTPESDRSVWEDGRIITYTEAHVDTLVAGSVAGATEIWVRTRGGNIGHLGQSVAGEATLTVGRPTLLFVRAPNAAAAGTSAYVVTARAQGQFPVVLDEQKVLRVHASADVGALVLPAGPPDAHPLAATILHGQAVVDAETTIARAWMPLHAH